MWLHAGCQVGGTVSGRGCSSRLHPQSAVHRDLHAHLHRRLRPRLLLCAPPKGAPLAMRLPKLVSQGCQKPWPFECVKLIGQVP